jgi:hypothetical protein
MLFILKAVFFLSFLSSPPPLYSFCFNSIFLRASLLGVTKLPNIRIAIAGIGSHVNFPSSR